MKASLNIYLFFMLSVISFSVFAGADPDELTLEEEMQMQKSAKKEMVEKVSKAEVIETVSIVPESCISFPEAIAFKEHFACHSDIEKLRLARLDWSFAKLIIRD
tara:strand:- start:28 stop:339 length:312 start_codon:yes stop_codon:yes gene_type:complete